MYEYRSPIVSSMHFTGHSEGVGELAPVPIHHIGLNTVEYHQVSDSSCLRDGWQRYLGVVPYSVCVTL
ncbi:hypothetical protein KIPB_004877 [Kipferlia bialata]|uniref:Uncharacterized protein n=1 Tax=Kipferlia bialata TaxID=797122 RepID=A0A9K3GII0_9EUKA|nr:hypothetical protein KIPB_004877 [Kipferlia bialata]|eukprot:g4877.t1